MVIPAEIRKEYNRLGERKDLAHLKDFARWDFIGSDDWTDLCRRTADFIGVEDGDRLFEAGCGSGAFLAELAAYRTVSLAGVDFAENLVSIARSRLSGDFRVADITDLSSVEASSYDKVLSHGVFLYLDSVDAARRAVLEMVRITRPGGTVYIGIVNDPDRHAEFEHPPSGSFILTRSFWRNLAEQEGLTLALVDQDSIFSKPSGYDCYSRIRYSLLLKKAVVAEP
ncbi:MAG: class I SAM-dependent methyltransferase [Chromatiales bacterium]|nr:class I SAM-dependent methyltransferase [Chromatiales bacterium]